MHLERFLKLSKTSIGKLDRLLRFIYTHTIYSQDLAIETSDEASILFGMEGEDGSSLVAGQDITQEVAHLY